MIKIPSRYFFLILCVFIIIFSCKENDNSKTIIASVYDKNLLLKDAIDQIPSKEIDSLYFLQQYIDKWIRKQLMIYNAEINLTDELKNNDKQIEEYRTSLLIYAYQEQLINQNFDTTVSIESITNYYNKYQKEFKLHKNIFRGRYIMIEKSAPNLDRLTKLYNNKYSFIELREYCQQFAKEYYLSDTTWQYFSLINNKLPNKIKNEEAFLNNTNFKYYEDLNYRYYIYINDFRIKGNNSPLELEKEKIKNVLLNKNKLKYLKEMEDKLYNNALALERIKIY